MKKGWAYANPVAAVDRPRNAQADADIRFLTHEEVEALLRSVGDDEFAAVDYPLFLVAVTCGLRQGELIALRWRDVDWVAGVIRVRINYTRGKSGTPKSRRSSRAVPMTTCVATELERLFHFDTPSAHKLQLPASHSAHLRSGWGIATTRRPSSTPTTRHERTSVRSSSLLSVRYQATHVTSRAQARRTPRSPSLPDPCRSTRRAHRTRRPQTRPPRLSCRPRPPTRRPPKRRSRRAR